MSFGVSGKVILGHLREMKVNNIRIPIMNKLRLDDRGDIIVNYVKKIHNAGGRDIGLILSVRRHNLGMVKQQEVSKYLDEDIKEIRKGVKRLNRKLYSVQEYFKKLGYGK